MIINVFHVSQINQPVINVQVLPEILPILVIVTQAITIYLMKKIVKNVLTNVQLAKQILTTALTVQTLTDQAQLAIVFKIILTMV